MSGPEEASTNPDPRTAEVLRALQRARGMVANGGPQVSVPGASRTPETLPRGLPANGGHSSQDVLESLASSVRFLETALVNAGEKLSDFQRSQDRAVQELRASVQDLKHQADVLAGWYTWGARRVTTWGAILALLVAGAVALSWRTHAVAVNTHTVLQQILENQARTQAAKSGRRR
jgi:hypothetical protein